ncbi:hypothetical protein PNEG_04010, partial [Pneumocystis murina B123]
MYAYHKKIKMYGYFERIISRFRFDSPSHMLLRDKRWVEEVAQKEAAMAQPVKRQAAGQAAGNDEIKEEQVLG